MGRSGNAQERRAGNARGLAAFGVSVDKGPSACLFRTIRAGDGVTLFTVGYERRDGEELMSVLREFGVEYLADIRDNPVSRKPDFRASALRALCEDAGIQYGPWTELGSTEAQRDSLHASGDFGAFTKSFRAHAKRNMGGHLDKLAAVAKKKVVALLCYERAHEDCHRSIVSEMLADRLGANVTAIL